MGNGQVHMLDALFLAKLKGFANSEVGRTLACRTDTSAGLAPIRRLAPLEMLPGSKARRRNHRR